MFAVGAGSIGWMLIFGKVMGIEKGVSSGRQLSNPLGIILRALGLLVMLGVFDSWRL